MLLFLSCNNGAKKRKKDKCIQRFSVRKNLLTFKNKI